MIMVCIQHLQTLHKATKLSHPIRRRATIQVDANASPTAQKTPRHDKQAP
jgi:hypothetical protein